MKQKFGVSLVLLLCITMLVGYSRKGDVMREAKASLLATISNKIGQKVEIGSGQWVLLPSPYLVFNNIVIDDSKVDRLRLDLSKEGLSRGEVVAKAIRIEGGIIRAGLLVELLELSGALPEDVYLEISHLKLTVDDSSAGNQEAMIGAMAVVESAYGTRRKAGSLCLPVKRQFICLDKPSGGNGMPGEGGLTQPDPGDGEGIELMAGVVY